MMKKKASVDLTVDDYMKMRYTIKLTPDEDLGWFASIEELPGCMSDGKCPETAVSSLREVQREWIALALEDMGSIPLPKSEQEYSGRFLVRTTPMLHRRLTEAADEEDVSTNQLCVTLLAEGLASRAVQQQMESIAVKVDSISNRLDMIVATVSPWRVESSKPAKVTTMPSGDYPVAQSDYVVEERSAEA